MMQTPVLAATQKTGTTTEQELKDNSSEGHWFFLLNQSWHKHVLWCHVIIIKMGTVVGWCCRLRLLQCARYWTPSYPQCIRWRVHVWQIKALKYKKCVCVRLVGERATSAQIKCKRADSFLIYTLKIKDTFSCSLIHLGHLLENQMCIILHRYTVPEHLNTSG